MRGLEWMPLFGDRLFTSETWLDAGPEARCAAIALWWAAWKQKPAGSLADSDRVLAQLAGYGMGIKQWLAVREGALRGFVKCSDGRLYHPVVCELALDAWERRKRDRARKVKWRGQATQSIDGQNEDVPRTETGTELGQDAEETRTLLPKNTPVTDDRTRQEKTGKERKEETVLRTGADAPSNAPPDARIELWREGLAILRRLTGRPEGPSRAFLGRLLKAAVDNCDAILQILHEAESLRPVDPEAWLTQAAQSRGKRAETGISARKEKILRAGGLWPTDGPILDHESNPRELLQ